MLKFDVHTDGLESIGSELQQACSKAEHILAQQIAKDTAQYVPMLTGSLNTRTKVEGNKIIYPGPYARFLYYGKVMIDPDTGSTWARKGKTKVVTERDINFTKDFHPYAQAHWFEASKAANLEKWVRVAEKEVGRFG